MISKYDLKKGIFLTLFSWLLFTIMTAVIKFTSQGTSVPQILLFQNIISLLFVLPWVYKYKISSLKTSRFGLLFLRSAIGLLGYALLFLAIEKISLVNAILLSNSAPIFIPFLAYLWLKSPFENKLWPGIIIGFIGIILILRPTTEIFNFYALYALGSALLMAYVMIATRMLIKTEKAHTILFYYFLLSIILITPFALYYWEPLTLPSVEQLLLIGFCSVAGQFTFTKAFEYAKPSHLGPFCYVAVIYSGLVEWLLWDTVPRLLTVIGIVLVCIGGILTIIFSNGSKEGLIED